MEGKYGAMHGLDIPFVFNTLSNQEGVYLPKRSEETELLSARMMDAWTSFARTGNPNHSGIPKWPQYDIKKRATLVFDNKTKIWDDPLKKEREMWYDMSIWSRF